MSAADARLRIGFIPLADAATAIVAVDKGFAAAEGLDVELVREVSWSNVRDKLNIGLFDAAHLLAPVAIASSLGIGHVKVPILAPFNLSLNGNAITVSPALYSALADAAAALASEASGQRGDSKVRAHGALEDASRGADARERADVERADDTRPEPGSSARAGDLADPMVSARALARVVAARRSQGAEPLTFGMTFPFSTHNYQLRFWMAAGGVDPDEDIRLVVLPPPYMVDSLANRHVDAFCVGAPWNSVAVDLGVGRILHFGSDILARASEKVLAVRGVWAQEHPDVLRRLLRAHARAASYVADPVHRDEVTAMLAAPSRLAVSRDAIRRTLDGRLKVAFDGTTRANERYLIIGRAGASRPDKTQAAWLLAQMVRWGQVPMSAERLAAATAVFRPDLYDDALPGESEPFAGEPSDGIGAFAGAPFDPADIAAHLAGWKIRRA
jgi:ABC-type nitrate/sulfonate/bicarbonate transport system substrate-binding protein